MRPASHRVNGAEPREEGVPRRAPRPRQDAVPRQDPLQRQDTALRDDAPPRDGRLRVAGLSGARALTRLLVALIEHLGVHDRVGGSAGRGWPHGTSLTAFGPSPFGAELERLMGAGSAPRPVPNARDAVTGLPFCDDRFEDDARHDAFAPPARDVPHGSPDTVATVQPKPPRPTAPPPVHAPPVSEPVSEAAPSSDPPPVPPPGSEDAYAATANIPAWQRPFIAAPGVRYMRTPDWVLRRPRGDAPDRAGPIAPLAAARPVPRPGLPATVADPPGDLRGNLEGASEAAPRDVPSYGAEIAEDGGSGYENPEDSEDPWGGFLLPDDGFDEPAAAIADQIEAFVGMAPFHTDTDEVDPLSIEDQIAFEPRRGLPQRLRMSSGFAVDLPLPANDPRMAPSTIAPPAKKQPFAIAVRPKAPKPTEPSAPTGTVAEALAGSLGGTLAATLAEEPAASAAAISARVTMPAMPAAPAGRRPVHVEWDYPAAELLAPARKLEGQALTADMLEQNARLLETTLEDFGVRGEIIHVRAGPVVTLYELEPAPGMKSSRVIGLADDIARSMSALSARVAVVPGRNAIGIELPNERRETVYFREMVESEAFNDSTHKLAIALGKTIGGEPVIADLAKMPHLLVAGTTGSGKSVAINTMILSLLYRLRPEECRLIMVDPKMLELSVYDGIPHLLTPVVTDPKKAVVALKWAVREMEDRYKKMSKLGVRNIDGFNARVVEAGVRGEPLTRTVQTGYDRDTGEAIYEHEAMDLTSLPYIVVIVDEMADLMMVAGKDIEGAIQRLAQMARAAGIHLIMATQRPSVDVITGTIKANFPTRISFQVTSKIDSRTILGEQGAEQLLGQGDMLHMQGGGRIYRVHGPFVSDGEVEKVVAHLKSQGQPDYLDTVTEDLEAEAAEDDDEAGDVAVFDKSAMGAADDDGTLYEQAIKVVLRDKKSSVSYVQRRLQVGYNKAASLIERMEKDGILGPASHTGKREILAHSRGRVISGVPVDAEVEG